MSQKSPASVVVGIDGSASAVHAAEWAVDEAVSRGLPLRLIHVIETGSEAVRLETEYAESALRTARAAVEAVGKRVEAETIVLRGHIKTVLAQQSRHAHIMCVGPFGVDYPSGRLLGSVATAMVESAHCPVVVIRTPNTQRSEDRCIVVVVDDSNTADAVLRTAMDEARLRNAAIVPLRVRTQADGSAFDDRLDRRMARWRGCYPDVAVHPVAVGRSLAEFLTTTDRSVMLAIVDTAGGDDASRLVGPSVVSRSYCSVMVLHPDHRRWSSIAGRSPNGSPTREMAR